VIVASILPAHGAGVATFAWATDAAIEQQVLGVAR